MARRRCVGVHPLPRDSPRLQPVPHAATIPYTYPLRHATPSATPTPSPAPTPSPTPTPTPTPTPAPLPASYRIAYDGVAFTGAGNGAVQTELSITITNTGESAGQDVSVRIAVDAGRFSDSAGISRLESGETVTLVISQPLAPGNHSVTFSVGGAEHAADVSILAADLAVELIDYAVYGNGSMAFEARVTNAGSIAAKDVALSAEWTAQPGADGLSGRAGFAALIARIEPGAGETTTLFLPVPTGAYDLTLSAKTATLEAATDDNTVEAAVEVEYVDLALTVEAARVTGYEHDGDGIVEIPFRVGNEGVSPSGPLTVGALCGGAPPTCSTSATLGSLPAGSSANASLTLSLPQGETLLTVYAGAPDNGYRWGERNAAQSAILVPEKPSTALALDAAANVLGYWSYGTAEVELALSLRNDGYRPVEDALAIAVTCHRDGGEPISECGGAVDGIALRDGFGPSEHVLRLRVPMGAELRAKLPDGAAEADPVTVPERILGIERDVWDCFSDRPDWEANLANDFLGGCGGWTSKTIRKWDADKPVRVWADPSGDPRYIRILEETLNELSPVLNLDFEWVNTKTQAMLKAYVGVPATRNAVIGFADYCEYERIAGCGRPDSYRGAIVTTASLTCGWTPPIRPPKSSTSPSTRRFTPSPRYTTGPAPSA